MLLILTCRLDTTVDWFVEKYLKTASIEWVRINTEEFPEHIRLSATPTTAQLFLQDERIIESTNVHCVWFRRPMQSIFTEHEIDEKALSYVREESESALRVFQSLLAHALWVNNPDCNRLASRKLVQLRQATEHGFRCPATLLSNDLKTVEAFVKSLGGDAIIKPIHKGSIMTEGQRKVFYSTRVTHEQIQKMGSSLEICPLIFQELIHKAYELRVVVLGDKCFAVRIDSQQSKATSVDWRRNPFAAIHSIYSLPDEIATKCIDMVRKNGLFSSSFDLVVTPEGEYVFLEHNPNGQFAWLEEKTGIPIGKEMLRIFENAQHK